MSNHYDVIVVGGGVIGGAIAYYLSRSQKRVLLMERDRIGSGSSQAAAGMLGAQSEMNGMHRLFDMSIRSRAMFPALAEELLELSGIDIELNRKGLLKVASTDSECDQLNSIIDLHHQAGQSAQWLTAEKACEMEPMLSEEIKGAMYLPHDGQVNALALTQAYASSAIKLGATVQERVDVKSLIIHEQRAIGVRTSEEEIYADRIVITSGIWSRSLLEQLGIAIDMYPVKGECFSVISRGHELEKTIFSEGCYLVPKIGGRIIVGATMDERNFTTSVSAGGLQYLLQRAIQLVPSLSTMPFEKAWSGLRPQTPDGLPIMGAVSSYKGLYIAAGHYRNGILLSPITGFLMSQLLEGEENAVKSEIVNRLQPYSIERLLS